MQYPCWQATEARFPCYTQFQRWAKSQQLLESNPALKLVLCLCWFWMLYLMPWCNGGQLLLLWMHPLQHAGFAAWPCFEIAFERVAFHSTAFFFFDTCVCVRECPALRCIRYCNFSSTKTNDNITCSPSLALRAASKAVLHNEENYWLACDRKEESRTPCNVLYSGLLPKGKTWECQKVSDKQLDVPL